MAGRNSPARQWLDSGRQIRLREALGDQHLDLEGGLELGSLEQLGGVLGSQMLGEQDHGGQAQPAVGQGVEDGGIVERRPRRADPLEGRVVRQVELVEAIGVHRVVTGGSEEAALLDLGDADDQLHGGGAFIGDERSQPAHQILVVVVEVGARAHTRFSCGGR